MRIRGQASSMNIWERQLYRQLSHAEPGDGDFSGLDACFTADAQAHRRVALEAACDGPWWIRNARL